MFKVKLRFNSILSSISIILISTGIASANNYEKFIIKFKDNSSSLDNTFIKAKLAKLMGDANFEVKKIANNTYSFELNKSFEESTAIINKLKSEQSIKYLIKDRVGYFKPVADPVPELNLMKDVVFSPVLDHSAQWDTFSAPQGVFLESKANLGDGAWRYSRGGTAENPVVVAVLDTGIEHNDDLTNNIVKTSDGANYFGWNFSKNNNDLSDETGGYHGTHVAGTIAGHGPTVMGMGTALQILPVKICADDGMFFESNVLRGIYWAIGEPVEDVPVNPYPAKVINMSFGIDEYVGKEVDECSPAVQEAIDYARSKGVVMVVAAGNSNIDYDLGSPGGCTGTMRVASTGPTGLRSYFSNYGDGITFAAPGGDKRYGQFGAILSTVKAGTGTDNTGYDFYQGTSMASPHVAGVAGLLYSVNDLTKNYTVQDIEKLLYTTSHDFGISYTDASSCRGNKSCGHGIINANNALEAGLANYDVLFSAPKSDLLGLSYDANCTTSMVSPTKTQIIKAEGTWVLEPAALTCQYAVDFNHPTLTLDSDNNQVTARYGHVVYKLKYKHSQCKQIGYDGIGCYK